MQIIWNNWTMNDQNQIINIIDPLQLKRKMTYIELISYTKPTNFPKEVSNIVSEYLDNIYRIEIKMIACQACGDVHDFTVTLVDYNINIAANISGESSYRIYNSKKPSNIMVYIYDKNNKLFKKIYGKQKYIYVPKKIITNYTQMDAQKWSTCMPLSHLFVDVKKKGFYKKNGVYNKQVNNLNINNNWLSIIENYNPNRFEGKIIVIKIDYNIIIKTIEFCEYFKEHIMKKL